MAFVDWTEEFSVGIKDIDDQHKILVGMLNQLNQGVIERKGAECMKKIILEMIAYAGTHFATEEKLMVKFGYPDYPNHKKEHDRFAKKAQDLKTRVEAAGFMMGLEVLTFLKDWLKNHILHTDKKYSGHFHLHGLN